MKVVIAIDSFKGSLSSMEAGNAVRDGIANTMVTPLEIIIKPLADGGEGTVEAIVSGMGGNIIKLDVIGALGNPITCKYGIIASTKSAIIEMAEAAGITSVPTALRNPMNTTTYGVGQLILDAIKNGCRNFIIGIGGSATNDGGIGMLEALGYEFYDADGNKVGPYGKDLLLIHSISDVNVVPELKECHFRVACDVTNPLYGDNGSSNVFGPQKGATPDMIKLLDQALYRYSEITRKKYNLDFSNLPGAGAAGGLGYAFVTYLGGKLESGISLILDVIGLEKEVMNADYVITGEGKLDFQTAMGKAPIGVAKLAKKHNKIVIAFSGSATPEARECNKHGIDAYFPVLQMPITVEEAIEHDIAYQNVALTAEQVFRLINLKNY